MVKGEENSINLWSNDTLAPSRLFSEICFHDNRIRPFNMKIFYKDSPLRV